MTLSLAAAAALLVETLPGDARELAWTFLAMLLASGLSASLVATRADRRRERAEVVRADADRTFDALVALRAACRRRVDVAPGAPDHHVLLDLWDVLDAAACRVSADVARAAAAYGRALVGGAVDDDETASTAEEQAYDRLVASLVRARNAYR